MNLLSIFKRNGKHKINPLDPEIKRKILKNKDGVLEMMGEKLEGNKMCPYLLGTECIGKFCMKFMEFKSINDKGEESSYWNCSDVQTPLLLIELNRNIRTLTDVMGGQKNEKTD